jgi:hypothetical protein
VHIHQDERSEQMQMVSERLETRERSVMSVRIEEARNEAVHLRSDRKRSQMRRWADINEAAAYTDLSTVCLLHC